MMLKRSISAVGLTVHLAVIHQAVVRDPVRVGEEDVLGDAEVEHASGVMAVFGNDRDAGTRHGAGATGAHTATRRPRPCRSRARAGWTARRRAPAGRCPRRRRCRRSRRRSTSSERRSSSTRPSRAVERGVDDAQHRVPRHATVAATGARRCGSPRRAGGPPARPSPVPAMLASEPAVGRARRHGHRA